MFDDKSILLELLFAVIVSVIVSSCVAAVLIEDTYKDCINIERTVIKGKAFECKLINKGESSK